VSVLDIVNKNFFPFFSVAIIIRKDIFKNESIGKTQPI
jgi:hypothetical protein